jgi:hypothetical protein
MILLKMVVRYKMAEYGSKFNKDICEEFGITYLYKSVILVKINGQNTLENASKSSMGRALMLYRHACDVRLTEVYRIVMAVASR